MRDVFTEFHAVTLRDDHLRQLWEVFDHDGRPVDTEGTAELADGLLAQLVWWTRSLREARSKRPYPHAG